MPSGIVAGENLYNGFRMGILGKIREMFKGGNRGEPPTPPNAGAPTWNIGNMREAPVMGSELQAVARVVLPLEGHDLDEQQLACIARNAHSHLVLAGAGTGKTTTVVGLVKYLLKTGSYSPDEILALSFTHASATELCARIEAETGQRLDAMTFHKLGMQIIAASEGKKPSVSDVPVRKFAADELKRQMDNPRYARMLGMYLHNRRNPKQVGQFDVSSADEYAQFLRENPPVTMRGERVKSLGEVSIANFLFFNGVDYEYERAYEHATATEEYSQYHPDFYLPASGTYIEFYAIDKRGKAPDWFEGRDGKTGSQLYHEGREWKRRIHAEHGTDCMELYAWQEMDGILTSELEAQLRKRGIALEPVQPERIWAALEDGGKGALDEVAALFGTLISLLKSTETCIEDARARCTDKRMAFTFKLLAPVYDAYNAMLGRSGKIDFDDMINRARRYVEDGSYWHGYRFVIIDEYQDISASRHGLVRAMREQSGFRLFCVGDDWQSIYRFSGSDVGFILNFARYWGESAVSRIETTRRFPQSLIDVSSAFVMANPNQARKQLRSSRAASGFAVEEINGYTGKWAVEFAVRRMEELPRGASVLLLGRYKFDLDEVAANPQCTVAWDARREVQTVRLAKRGDLDVVFRTVHGSKGLEADYVFVLNNRDGGAGFPSRVADDPAVDLLLSSSDDFPDAEERRLFYVALTRAREKVFLLTVKDKESCFFDEVYERWGEQMEAAKFTCPLCGGRLRVIDGQFGKFWGCENYRVTGCKFTRTISRKGDAGSGGQV